MRIPAMPARMPHHAAHRHDAAVTGVAVHDHRDRHTVDNPASDRYAFGHRRGADIGKTGISAHYPAGTDEQRLATRLLHDPGMRRSRRVQDSQNLARRWISSCRCADFDFSFIFIAACPLN